MDATPLMRTARTLQSTVCKESADRVILSGTASTWSQRDAAELAAIHAPGVTQVDNHITVSPTPLAEDEDEIC